MAGIVARYNVQDASHGTALYLDRDCDWSTNADDAFEYDCQDEAETDAEAHGGEVFRFERLARPSDVVIGHNVASRLERWSAAAE
jgi:predicted dithiol-disulfide oxidoreductase (DUF899 family)